MSDNVFLTAWADLMNPVKRRQAIERQRVMALFTSREHARKVWDQGDETSCESPGLEDAWLYLQIIGDGSYCTV
jgi:uncharacterized protein YaeQ